MHGNKVLRDWQEQSKPTSEVTDPKVGPKNKDEGSEEASDRCGLENPTHPQYGIVLVLTDTKTPIGISYSAFKSTVKWMEPCALAFLFEDLYLDENDKLAEGVFEVLIVGGDSPDAPKMMELLQMRLIQSKRESLKANGSFIKEIRIRKVEEEEET